MINNNDNNNLILYFIYNNDFLKCLSHTRLFEWYHFHMTAAVTGEVLRHASMPPLQSPLDLSITILRQSP